MTDSSVNTFDALRLPSVPIAPRLSFSNDLKVRLHRRLGLEAPDGFVPMRKAVGLEYEVGGSDAGEAVLFMHAGTATAYLPLVREPVLADRYRLVRYHRRGFAGSDESDRSVSIRGHVRDALALLDHLGIERAHVVGHSGSGVIALQLAIDAPERVRSLVLEEPAIHAIDPRSGAAMREVIELLVARSRLGDPSGAMEGWMRGIALTWRADLARTVPGGPQQTIEDASAFFADVEAVAAWPADAALVERIAMPVLYVRAAGGGPFARTVLRWLRELVPQTESAVIADAGHMLHTDQPALVAAELDAFFARHADRT